MLILIIVVPRPFSSYFLGLLMSPLVVTILDVGESPSLEGNSVPIVHVMTKCYWYAYSY